MTKSRTTLTRRIVAWYQRQCLAREQQRLLKSGSALKVLLFHGLYDDSLGPVPADLDPLLVVSLTFFRKCLEDTLKQGFRFIHPDEITEASSHSERLALLTFDDGYANNLLALPILRELKIPALIFVTTDSVLRQRAYWWDVLAKETIQCGIPPGQVSEIRRDLKKLAPKDLETYMEQTFGELCYHAASDQARPMNIEELQRVAKDPLVRIGNHTHNHALLTQLDKASARQELEECQNRLFDLIGETPQTLAYPNGRWSEEVAQIARDIGIRFAFTTQRRLCALPLQQNQWLSIPRLQLSE